MIKYYFLIFLLYSSVCTPDPYSDDCHKNDIPVNSAEECLSRVTEVLRQANMKCCFFEGTKKDDGSSFKECRTLEPPTTIEKLKSIEDEYFGNIVVSYTCDANSESESESESDSQSRSNSKYLHLGLLSLLILI